MNHRDKLRLPPNRVCVMYCHFSSQIYSCEVSSQKADNRIGMGSQLLLDHDGV